MSDTPRTDAARKWSAERGWPVGTHPMSEVLARMADIERDLAAANARADAKDAECEELRKMEEVVYSFLNRWDSVLDKASVGTAVNVAAVELRAAIDSARGKK